MAMDRPGLGRWSGGARRELERAIALCEAEVGPTHPPPPTAGGTDTTGAADHLLPITPDEPPGSYGIQLNDQVTTGEGFCLSDQGPEGLPEPVSVILASKRTEQEAQAEFMRLQQRPPLRPLGMMVEPSSRYPALRPGLWIVCVPYQPQRTRTGPCKNYDRSHPMPTPSRSPLPGQPSTPCPVCADDGRGLCDRQLSNENITAGLGPDCHLQAARAA